MVKKWWGSVSLFRIKFKAFKVVLIPVDLVFNNSLEGFQGEGLARTVKRDCDPPPVRVAVVLVRAGLPV